MSEIEVFCVHCGEVTEFDQNPVEVKTRIGARRRLKGRCARCGHEISCFLLSEDGPTVHSVKVGESTKRELERAASLLEISQRAIVENVLRENLEAFVVEELKKLEEGGLITARERAWREEKLAQPIRDWELAEVLNNPAGFVSRLLKRLKR